VGVKHGSLHKLTLDLMLKVPNNLGTYGLLVVIPDLLRVDT